jgi:hypothetical protein
MAKNENDFQFDYLSRRFSMPHRVTLVTAREGGPIRTIINGGSRHAMGRYASAKSGRGQPWKTTVERSRYMVCEIDPDIKDYLAFPHRLEFLVGRRKVTFWPSLRVEYRSGKIGIERLPNRRKNPKEDSEAVGYAKDVYARLGWSYVSLGVVDIEGGQDFANARNIELDKDVLISGLHISRAAEAIAAGGGTSTYAAVRGALGGGRVGQSILHGLIVRGHVALDIDKRIKATTPVWAPR